MEFFSGLDYCNNRLYFNTTTKICSIDLEGNDMREEYMPVLCEGSIYGHFINGTQLTYVVLSSPNDNQYIDKETIKIADKIQVRSIQIEADNDIKINTKQQLTISVKPKMAETDITWAVDNEKIGSVTEDGILTVYREGIINVTATASDGSNITATKEITVTADPQVPVSDVVSDYNSGLISKNTYVSLSTDTVNADIHYTLDGSNPTEESAIYTEPICITQSTVLKARAFHRLRPSSKTVEFNYSVLVPNSITYTLNDYSYILWNSGKKMLNTLEFDINNVEARQNTVIILAVYKNNELITTCMMNNVIIEDGNNNIGFSNINTELNSSNTYSVRLFIWSADYDMYPLGKINKFSI